MYFKEDASSIFAQSTKSVRFNIIKNSLQVDRYDRYAKEAKKDLDSLMDELSKLSEYITAGNAMKEELEENLSQTDITAGKISKLKGLLINIDHKLSSIQSERSSCEIKLSEIKSAEAQRAETNNVISEIDKQINSVKAQMKKHQDDIVEYKRTVCLIKSDIDTIKVEMSKITVLSEEGLEVLKESMNNANVQISLNRSKIQEMNEKIKVMQSATGSQCWACNKPLTEDESTAIISEARSVITISQNANKTLEAELVKIQSAIKKTKENGERLSKLEGQIDRLNSKAETTIELSSKAKSQLASLDYGQMEFGKKEYIEKVEAMSKQINLLRAQVKSVIDRKESIDSEERALSSQKNSVMGDIAEANQKLGELKARAKEIKELIKDIDDKQTTVAKLWDRRTVIENFLAACSKKGGIPTTLISQAIVEIQKFANDTLYKFDNYDGMQIKMEMDKPDEIEISVRMGSEVDYRDFDTFSGGERFIISFAIRMALAQVLSKKYGADIKFILLDEAGTALDEYNTTRFADMVKRLSKDTLILLITHQNNLRDFIQQNIFVRRSGGKSSILTNVPGSMNNVA
jgi:DNA repair exonuclease SbcCD ATPase subunit